jgi:acyl carrier protein
VTTLDRLRPIFERVFNGEIVDFGPHISPDDIKRWDSVTHVTLILEIEETFEIEFRVEDLGGLESVAAIAEAVDQLRATALVRDRE